MTTPPRWLSTNLTSAGRCATYPPVRVWICRRDRVRLAGAAGAGHDHARGRRHVNDVERFAGLLAAVSAVVGLAILSSRLSERIRVPAPALFLVSAAVASALFPELGRMPIEQVQRIVTVCLVLILFDGGMGIGLTRFRREAGPIAWLGVAGTLVTAAAMAVLAHLLFDLGWQAALLLGTALAPTDPAVVFSVLGRREISGRSSVLLKGESGANDPVGIALMTALLVSGGSTGWPGAGTAAREFALQMLVGVAVGVSAGPALLWLMRRVTLPSAGLYPLRTLAAAGLTYGVATLAHGSGFLAVFVCGIWVGDAKVAYRREIEQFHSALASLGEIVAFTVLGLTVSLHGLTRANTLLMGLVLAVLLALVVRPVLVGLVLAPVRLATGERVFVLWAGLKGAVPILLGTYVLSSGVADATRLYSVVFVVVTFSVVVQGGLVPVVARACGLRMTTVEPGRESDPG
jgi:cell volume regulation protein A